MRIEIAHNDPEDCSREQSKEPRCELEHSKDSSAKTRWRANRGQPYYSAGPTSQQPKQMVNALAMSSLIGAGVMRPELGTGMNINNSIIALKPHEIIE